MPCTQEQAQIYFGDLFKAWFSESNKVSNKSSIEETFLKGGYYRYDFENKPVSLLALNTMYFMSENMCMLNQSQVQLDWFEKHLSENKASPNPRKFILSMHVFPGLNYYMGKKQVFWHQDVAEKFEQLLHQYQNSI